MKVLVVEGSDILRDNLALGLSKAGYLVDTSPDGEDGLWRTEEDVYDAIVLDLGLPKLNGMQVLVRMRDAGNQTPVLVLTARDAIDDRVTCLRAGADDYLIKPFAFDELQARLESLMRRSNGVACNKVDINGLKIDLSARSVKIGSTSINLSRREYALLELLALKAGEVVNSPDIEAKIYDEHVEPNSYVVDAAVSILRKAIDQQGSASRIATVRGQGYRVRNS